MADARLEIEDAEGRRWVALEKEITRIGRRADNDISFPFQDVSREHAEIIRENGGYVVRDLKSRHGTFVNGQQIQSHRLAHGDRVRLGPAGQAEFVFLLTGTGVHDTTGSAGPAPTPAAELRIIATLLDVLKDMGSGGVLEQVLARVIDAALEVTGTERGFVMLANPEGELEFKLARGRGGQPLTGDAFEISRKIPPQVFETGEPVFTDLYDTGMASKHGMTVALGIRGVLCTPLRLGRFTEGNEKSSSSRPIGVLYLDSKRRTKNLSAPARSALESVANEAAILIDNARLYREVAEKARLEHEIEVAAEIQKALLPPRAHQKDWLDAAGMSIPCRAIGGDFFEYIDRTDGRIGFALGDVAGKGPPAALLAAVVHGIFAYQSEDREEPAVTLARMNRALVRRIIESRFATMAYAVVAPDGQLEVSNAGHNPLYLVRSDESVELLEKGGLPLGLFEEAAFEEESTTMGPGDTLVFYSDGVTEAMSPDGELYGDDRLKACLEGTSKLSADEVLTRMVDSVNSFAAGQPQADDITVLVVRYRGPVRGTSETASPEASANA